MQVIEINITNEEIEILRIPKGKEGQFCMGIKEKYILSDKVRININNAKLKELIKNVEA